MKEKFKFFYSTQEFTMSHTSFTQHNWENYARCYDGLNALRPYRELLSTVKNELGSGITGRICEAACGTGNLTELLCANDQGEQREIYGIDYSAEMLARAKAKCEDCAHLIRADLNEPLPFPSEYFDAVVSVNTL